MTEFTKSEELNKITFDIGERALALPFKSPNYFVKRYLQHPFYAYRIFGIQQQSKNLGLIVLRGVSHQGARALRLVDYWGASASLVASRPFLEDLLRYENAEYIDAYNHGICSDVFAAAGFHELQASGCVIPNYFEPFKRQNIRIRYAFKAPRGQKYIFFKADCDQDRPNLIS